MKKAAWVIPSFVEGSGGYRTIFQHVNEMAKEYQCFVFVYDSGDYKDDLDVTRAAFKFYGQCDCIIHLGYDIVDEDFDLLIATSWLTVEVVYKYKGSAKKIYFVQDYEPMFYPAGDQYLSAAGTYELGFNHITIGRWLTYKIQQCHNAKSMYYDFCADKKIYQFIEEKEREEAVCFVFQPEKPRRATKLGIEALKLVKMCLPEVKVYLYGSREKVKLPFEYIHLGILSPSECADLYQRCKVGLCISSSNPSRVPYEMMACGLPVVDIYMENNLYDYQEGTVTLAQCRSESIAQAILNIFNDPILQKKIENSNINYMKNRDMHVGLRQFMDCIHEVVNANEFSLTEKPEITYLTGPIKATYQLVEIKNNLKPDRISCFDWLKRKRWFRKIPGIKKLKWILRG